MRIVVAVFRRRHATSRRRIRVYALQNARAMYLMRAPSRSTRARSFVPSRVDDSRRDGRLSERVAGRIKSQNRPVTTREVNIENTIQGFEFVSSNKEMMDGFGSKPV